MSGCRLRAVLTVDNVDESERGEYKRNTDESEVSVREDRLKSLVGDLAVH